VCLLRRTGEFNHNGIQLAIVCHGILSWRHGYNTLVVPGMATG
jgi:hypothetical protein